MKFTVYWELPDQTPRSDAGRVDLQSGGYEDAERSPIVDEERDECSK